MSRRTKMKHTEEEIRRACNILVDTCSDFECDICPFRMQEYSVGCEIQVLAEDWDNYCRNLKQD